MIDVPRWKVTLQIGRNQRAHTTAVWAMTQERANELAEIEAYYLNAERVVDVERF